MKAAFIRETGPASNLTYGDLPTPDDVASEFSVDQSTLGPLLNDTDANGDQDLHDAPQLSV